MRKLLVIVPLVGLSTACVYPAQSLSRPYPGQSVMYPRPVGPQVDVASLPIGRWDNVMMSGVGTPVMVLTMDSRTASGEIVTATSDTLRLRVASGEVEIAAADVMRVDRLAGGPRELVKDGARGAAFGAGVVGVLGLITGHVPPPRLFAAGGDRRCVPELRTGQPGAWGHDHLSGRVCSASRCRSGKGGGAVSRRRGSIRGDRVDRGRCGVRPQSGIAHADAAVYLGGGPLAVLSIPLGCQQLRLISYRPRFGGL